MIRKCALCKGNKLVLKIPSAQILYPHLMPLGEEVRESVCLCSTCKGFGKQQKVNGVWSPYPKEVIRI